MKKANIYNFLLIIGAIFFLSVGCNDRNDFELKKELEFLDSLDVRLAVVEQKLNIDMREINERIEEMSMDIGEMKFTEKTIPLAMAQMMDKYVAIHKNYKSFYERFKTAKTEHEAIKIQVATLRNSVIKKEYSKKKFKEFYAQEDKALTNLEQYIEANIQPTLDFEFDYRRIQKEIDQFLYGDELKKMQTDKN